LQYSSLGIIYVLLFFILYCAILFFFIIDNLNFDYYKNYPTISFVGKRLSRRLQLAAEGKKTKINPE
jgi:hypothetical protein